jgi:hypothetical protein
MRRNPACDMVETKEGVYFSLRCWLSVDPLRHGHRELTVRVQEFDSQIAPNVSTPTRQRW